MMTITRPLPRPLVFMTLVVAMVILPTHNYHHHGVGVVEGFTVRPLQVIPVATSRTDVGNNKIGKHGWTLYAAGDPTVTITRLSSPDDDDDAAADAEPIPFLDQPNNSFIECYADAIATFDDGTTKTEYTIGVPCDYCVALCYSDDDGQLVPIELEDELMDDVYSIAENIVSEEFEDELALQRTPQTLTLVGELEEDDDDDEDDEDAEDDEDEFDDEEVELLLSFEHRDREFSLVRLMDPVLIVGKTDPERPDVRVLLSPEESEWIMPILESAFLKYSEEEGEML